MIALGAVALVVAIVLVGGRTRGPQDAAAPGPAPSISVEVSGCAAVLAGPICELPADGALRLWASASPGAVTFETSGAAVSATTLAELQGGTLHRVVVAPSDRELRVRSHAGTTISVLRLAAKSAPSWVERATASRQRGDVKGATTLIAAADASREVVDRAFAQGLRARLELAAGRTEASFPLFREAVRMHRELGRLSDAADDTFALAFALNQRSHRYTEARSALDGVRADLAVYPDGLAREAYYRGTLASETGDARSALQLLRGARDHAARLGLALLERNAINAYALQLELVGRVPEALDLLRDLATRAASAADVKPCEKVEIAINTGFGALLANEQSEDEPKPFDPVAPLERAVALCRDGCTDRYLLAAALGNLALAALQRGDTQGARTHLAEARAGMKEARALEVLFWRELEGRIALADGDDARALAAFEEEASRARDTLSYEAEWRARVGKGTALERLRKNDEALDEYRAAEELLTNLSLLVPLGEGRGTFVGDRGRSAKLAIDLLARLGRAEDALAMVRSSRARVVAGLAQRARLEGFDDSERSRWEKALGAFRTTRAALDQEAKDDWKLPRADAVRAWASREGRETELRAALDTAFALFAGAGGSRTAPAFARLPEDTLTLAFHPVRLGWVGLLADRSGVTSFAIPKLPASDDAALLGERLLSPLRARLPGASRLRVLPFGPLRSVDFHALPFEGKPLVATIPIEYPLDLPAMPERPSAEGQIRALIIADPTLDLAGARLETDRVVGALRDRGSYQIDVLEGSQATSAAILPLLGRATLFHYAGHGLFAGREGWQSALPLAGGGHLTIGDVLASAVVPRRVVLSGCETARAAADGPVEALGLAQAFVVAGADFVIAPIRPVGDALAARMASALYGELAQSGAVDSASVLREAQQKLRAEQPALDWSAFRVLCR